LERSFHCAAARQGQCEAAPAGGGQTPRRSVKKCGATDVKGVDHPAADDEITGVDRFNRLLQSPIKP